MDELTGIALGHVNRLGNQAVQYAREIDRANGEVRKANAEIEKANQIIANLNARIAELELALAVKEATEEADNALFAQWKTIHPQSPLRQVVGKWKDGSAMTKSQSMWNAAFDAAARKRGITNPLAHRIS